MDSRVINYLKNAGYKVLSDENLDLTTFYDTWENWYKGYVPTFHEYSVYTGSQKINMRMKQMNMAGKVCEKWADLLLNEKVEITIGDDHSQEVLDRLLKQTNFFVRGNNLIERAFAMGAGYFVQYWDGKKTNQKYISQENAYPISYDSGRITEIAFASEKMYRREKYVYLEIHTLNDAGEYVIENQFLKNTQQSLIQEDIDGIEPVWETHSATPKFQQIRPNVANKYAFSSPYGISVFNDAIDILKELDFVFDSYYKEFLLGKKRIFVADGTTNIRVDKDGNMTQVFDPHDEVFYALPKDLEDSDPIHEVNGNLRVGDHNLAIQTLLGELSQSCGLGNDGFKWNESSVATATQIISKNSEMFRALKKHEAVLEEAVINMAKSLLEIEAEYNGESIDLEADISVNFDDSIIEDTAEIKRQAMLELQSGLIDPIEYYQRVYKMTEEQAIEFRNSLKERNPQPMEEPPMEDEEV